MLSNPEALRHTLDTQGWYHGPCPADEVLETVAHLGTIIDKTEVVVQPDPDGTLFTHDEMVTHTDHPNARYLLWYCVQNDATGGWSILKDAHACYLQLTEAQQEHLGRIQVWLPDRGRPQTTPMVTLDADAPRPRFCCIPWAVKPSRDIRAWSAFRAFDTLITESEGVRLHLEADEILVVDNTWMLHGRSAITPASQRRLTRYWIQAPAAQYALTASEA